MKPTGKKRAKKILLIVLIVIVSLVVVLTSAFLIVREVGRRSLLRYDDVQITPSNVDVIADESGKNVTYNGHTYQFNEDVTTILCMGVDKTEFADDEVTPGTAGQADAIFLFSIDTKTGRSTLTAVSRDSMVDVSLYSAGGAYLGTEKKQLCLSFAYGDGKSGSCENTVSAVSRLLYGLPINSYFAVDYEAVKAINDKIGGVAVTPTENLKLSNGTTLKSGQSFTLKGEDVVAYIRNRDKNVLDSNNSRIKRQQQYLKSFTSKAISATKSDITTPIKLYNAASGYMVTNVDVPEVTYLTSCLLSGSYSSNIDFRSVPGSVVAGEDSKAQFTPDDTALYELILDVFYTRAD